MITRGSMIVGLRSRFSERKAHIWNLELPMVLQGLWDSSLFLNVATGVTPSAAQFAVYPLAIACVMAVLRQKPATYPIQ
jgi:hypothetical protein